MLNLKKEDKKSNCENFFKRNIKIYQFLSGYEQNQSKFSNKFSFLFKLLAQEDISEIKCLAMIKESASPIKINDLKGMYCKYELTFQKIIVGKQTNFLVIFKNIAEEEKLLNQFNNFKNRLFQSFSHEIKTPLNGAIIPLQLCISDDKCPESLKTQFLLQSNSSLQKLKYQIFDIIDMQLILENQFQLNISQINLKELIDEIIEIFQPIIKEKELEFKLNIDENLPNKLFTDSQRLNQVIYNLISNAIKFTRKGFIIFTVKNKEENFCKIKISDTGTGIMIISYYQILQGMSQDEQNRLNLIFQTPDFSIQTGQSGKNMSLGLTISQNLAIQLGTSQTEKKKNFQEFIYQSNLILFTGKQEQVSNHQNNKDRASNFIFERIQLINQQQIQESEEIFSEKNEIKLMHQPGHFQVQKPQNDEDFKSIIKEPSSTLQLDSSRELLPECGCPKILIVDDDIFNLRSLELLLNKLGLQVNKANNGKEAVEIFMDRMVSNKCPRCMGIQLILMDYQMPIMDGVEATIEIRAIMEKFMLDYAPIIACSAFDAQEDVDKCKMAGMNQYIKKPISFLTIKNMLTYYDILCK